MEQRFCGTDEFQGVNLKLDKNEATLIRFEFQIVSSDAVFITSSIAKYDLWQVHQKLILGCSINLSILAQTPLDQAVLNDSPVVTLVSFVFYTHGWLKDLTKAPNKSS